MDSDFNNRKNKVHFNRKSYKNEEELRLSVWENYNGTKTFKDELETELSLLIDQGVIQEVGLLEFDKVKMESPINIIKDDQKTRLIFHWVEVFFF